MPLMHHYSQSKFKTVCCLFTAAFLITTTCLVFCPITPYYEFMPNQCVGGIQITLIILGILGATNLVIYKCCCKQQALQIEPYEQLNPNMNFI